MNDQNIVEEPVKMDDLPINKFHVKITALSFGAHFTDGYSLGTIGMAVTLMQNQIYLSPQWMGLLGASALIGLFFGSIILGAISGKIGRQKIFVFNFATITVCSFLQLFVADPVSLFVLRILIGFALGGDYAVGGALLAEFAPKKARGIMLGALSVLWTVGFVCANTIGVLLIAHAANPDIWRWLLASASIPALVVLILRSGTPESPRWLMSKGRREEAMAIIHRHLGPHVSMADEEVAEERGSGLKDLINRQNRKRTAFGGLFFLCIGDPILCDLYVSALDSDKNEPGRKLDR